MKTVPSGFLDQTSLALDETGRTSATLRSDGLGHVGVIASLAGFPETQTDIEFRFPWTTLLASMLGGIIGALIRVLSSATVLSWRHFAGSVLCGILGFTLYAIGVNLLLIEPSINEGALAAFALSGIGGYIGTAVFKASEAISGDS